MTSFAFILGVVPLALATGAGAEMRQSLGTAVFFGMLGVTLFGLIFTPVFYVADPPPRPAAPAEGAPGGGRDRRARPERSGAGSRRGAGDLGRAAAERARPARS